MKITPTNLNIAVPRNGTVGCAVASVTAVFVGLHKEIAGSQELETDN